MVKRNSKSPKFYATAFIKRQPPPGAKQRKKRVTRHRETRLGDFSRGRSLGVHSTCGRQCANLRPRSLWSNHAGHRKRSTSYPALRALFQSETIDPGPFQWERARDKRRRCTKIIFYFIESLNVNGGGGVVSTRLKISIGGVSVWRLYQSH